MENIRQKLTKNAEEFDALVVEILGENRAKEDQRRNDNPITDEHYSQIAEDVVKMEALRSQLMAVQRELEEDL